MKENFKSCSFFGHSEINITNDLTNQLENLIEDLILNQNFRIFYFGGFGMFDKLCWQITTQLKQKYPNIKRIFCLSNKSHLNILKRPSFLKNENYEEFTYIDLKFDFWKTRIYYRNCEIINLSNYTIFYVNNTKNSGAYQILKYAQKTKSNYINIAK